jgi:hypothetical protein
MLEITFDLIRQFISNKETNAGEQAIRTNAATTLKHKVLEKN